MKTIGITGGTGFIGRHLTELLTNKGYNVIIFTTRKPESPATDKVGYALWNPTKGTIDKEALARLDGMVHLAGAGIADKRLTSARKKEILESRVFGTRLIVASLKAHSPNCKVFVASSAIGYYGPDETAVPFKEDAPPYPDFLGETCALWEKESMTASGFVRTCILRTGIVLGKESGAFPQFEQPMAFGIMPLLGSGRQIVSWIEVEDMARMFLHAIEKESMSGVYNAVAPHPVSHSVLMHTIARIKGGLKIPAPVPAFILKIMLGELSTEVLKSCNVSAQKTLDSGFRFLYPELDGAVRAILGV